MKKIWQTLSAVAFSAALTLPALQQADAATFTYTPTKPLPNSRPLQQRLR